jgi:hypothetical protein
MPFVYVKLAEGRKGNTIVTSNNTCNIELHKLVHLLHEMFSSNTERKTHSGSGHHVHLLLFFFPMARQPYMGLGLLVSSRFHNHTHFRHTTVGRTPLDEGPARRRDLYLTTHNTYKRQTSMTPVGFEPKIPVSERPKTHALDRAATGIGIIYLLYV